RRPAAPIDTRRARRSTAENASPNTSRTAPPRKFPFTKRPTTAIAYTAALVNAILTIRVQGSAPLKSRGRFIALVLPQKHIPRCAREVPSLHSGQALRHARGRF